MNDNVTFAHIAEAADVLRGVAHVTPIMTSRQLDALTSGQVFLKCENFQRTGAFKFRGAYNALAHLKSQGNVRLAATISSGNHGQGLALAAGLTGLSAHIVMPQPVSSLKYEAVVGYGGTVTLADSRPSAEERLQELVRQPGVTYVHAFDDPHVIAGQGTIVLELLAQVSGLDVLLAPVGGGGLLSGLCIAGHHLMPALKVFACEPEGAADARESIRLNQIVPMPNPMTLADGLRTSLGTRTLPILRNHLADVWHVSEAEILRAMQFAYERLKLVVEPSSAVALAPILRREPELIGKRIAVVLTGGNIDLESLRASLKADA